MPPALAEATASLNRASNGFLAIKAKEWVRLRHQEFARNREVHEKRWARCWAAYWGKVPRTYYNGRAGVTPPDIHVRVERLVPRLEAMTIGRSDFFEPRSREPSEARQARLNKDLMTHQLEMDGFRANFGASFCRDVVVYGTGVAKLGWRYEVENNPWVSAERGELDTENPGYSSPYTVEEKPVIVNSPHGEPRDPFNVWADDRVDWPEETDIIEDAEITVNDLIQLRDNGLADPDVVARILAEPSSEMSKEGQGYKEKRDTASGLTDYPRQMDHALHLKYREFWGLFPLDLGPNDDSRKVPVVQCVIAIVNNNHVIRLSPNPFRGGWKPYEFPKVIKLRGELYGKSLVDAALELWVEKRDTRNMMLDTRAYNIQPMFTADPGHRGTAYAAGLGKVLRGANLRQVQIQDNTASGMNQEALISADLDDLFATPPLLSGDQLGGSGGATGASIQDQNATVNLRGYAITLEETFFKRILGKWHSLNQQFLDDVTALSVMGENGTEWRYIYPADINGKFEFVMTGATQMQSRAVLGAQFFNATSVMQNAQMAGAVTFDWSRWYRTYFKEVLGFDHPELYVNPMERGGPVLSLAQTLELLLLGHKVTPDPRANIMQMFKEMSFFVDGFVDQIDSRPVQENILAFYRDLEGAVQQMILARAQALEQQKMALLGAAPPPKAEAKGKDSAPEKKGPEQRDGKGMEQGRRLMAAMAGGPVGAGPIV